MPELLPGPDGPFFMHQTAEELGLTTLRIISKLDFDTAKATERLMTELGMMPADGDRQAVIRAAISLTSQAYQAEFLTSGGYESSRLKPGLERLRQTTTLFNDLPLLRAACELQKIYPNVRNTGVEVTVRMLICLEASAHG